MYFTTSNIKVTSTLHNFFDIKCNLLCKNKLKLTCRTKKVARSIITIISTRKKLIMYGQYVCS